MYMELEKKFAEAAYTVKAGEIVVKDGEVKATPLGRTYWVDADIPEDLEAELYKDLEQTFRDYYTVSLRNYPVQDEYLPTGYPVKPTGGEWR